MRFSTSPKFLLRIFLSFAIFLFILSILSKYYSSPPTTFIGNKNQKHQRNYYRPFTIKNSSSKTKFNQFGVIFDETAFNYSYFNTDFSKLSSICEGNDAGLCSTPLKKHNSQIYVVPERKLAACLIPKNMSTMLRALMCYLLDPKKFIKYDRTFASFSTINICHNGSISNFGSFDAVKSNIKGFNPATWTLLGLFRDPVERLVSTFLDQCIRQKQCKLCRSNFVCFLHQAYQDIMAASKTPGNEKVQDTYLMKFYFPQNWDCEISEYFNNYIKLQYTSLRNGKNKFYDSLAEILRNTGVGEIDINFILQHLKTEKTSQSTQENAILAPIGQTLISRIRKSTYLSEIIVRMYYHDYKLFGFDIPDLKQIYFDEKYNKK